MKREDRVLFEKHAAPEAIEHELQIALLRLALTECDIKWLRRLLKERKKQIKAGTWPAKQNEL